MAHVPPDLPEEDSAKIRRLTEAVMSGLYDEVRAHYIDMLLGFWAFGATRDQLLSDVRPVEEVEFSETALDSLLNDGTFIFAVFEAPHPYTQGQIQECRLILHRDNAGKVEVHRNPEKYRQQWAEFQATRCIGYPTDNPTMNSPNYPWNNGKEFIYEPGSENIRAADSQI